MQRRNLAFYPRRKAILLRAFERPSPKPLGAKVFVVRRSQKRPCRSERSYREESAFGWLLSGSRARTLSRCGNHLEILWEAM